ncbi:amphoterin-induced protein 3-like isoform X1 [Carassius auratus]|uniref:Amphoterin-induced protein 3-like isoform X1 n=1 Tax=Carassius auratus TaxID=7957 RepID=A0A6P6M7F0_CARAU|nr:amphoterin-induced protein 3-like isoform X1 [Carassius auratus]XP_026092157.1 amphoterin-induced protein 3-like isoform X1 [Carassius auratus]
MLCTQGGAAPLMLSSFLLQLVRANLPSGCLIASDILSCTNLGLNQVPGELPGMVATLDFNHNRLERLEVGSFAGLPNLDTIRLAHNQLSRLTPGTFRNTSNIRHLDLSSNQLNIIEEHYFLELVGIKELLLYNNQIVRVESKALIGLINLRKAYLSHNRLTDFPFFSIQEHPNLTTLDLSSNRMPNLPVKDIAALKEKVQKGLFLHNNSLICECSMYSLIKQWEYRGFTSITDFREEHTCLLHGEQRAMVRFLKHVRYFENCVIKLPTKRVSMEADAGKSVMLDCITSLKGKHLNYSWISPSREYIAPPGNSNTLRMYLNGSLEILVAKENDSGVYLCMVHNHQESHNDSLEVNVTVQLRIPEEPFNTGFTTLLGCVVSLVLVLMYLYLTPCRCWCLPATPRPVNECSAQSSILTPTPPATTEGPGRKVSNNKHVVFLEPIKEAQNGRPRAALALEHPKLAVTRSDADSVTSIFSDTTIVP